MPTSIDLNCCLARNASNKQEDILTRSDITLIVSAIITIASTIIMTLGLMHHFGAIGSVGYIGAVAGGGVGLVGSFIAYVVAVPKSNTTQANVGKASPGAEIVDKWSVNSQEFSITPLQKTEIEQAVNALTNAYFDDSKESLKVRDQTAKEDFRKKAVETMKKRYADKNFQIFVCKVEDKVVGTVYYQREGTSYDDELDDTIAQDVPELGWLAVDPAYQKKNQIGKHLIEAVKNVAIKEGKRGIYIWVKGKNDNNQYSNELLKYYKKVAGFVFVSNRIYKPKEHFKNPLVDQVVMVCDLSKQTGKPPLQLMKNNGMKENYTLKF